MKKFDYLTDGGHGWTKVPVKLLIALNIADKVSHFSYYRAGFGYLEEDCDTALFFDAYNKKFGFDPILRERIARERRSRIRGYHTYNKAQHILKKLLLSKPAALRINAAADIVGA
jgi:hypothetical protein